jgi:hypothetical protein
MTTQEIDYQLTRLNQERDEIQTRIDWLNGQRSKLESLEITGSWCNEKFDFDNLPHDKIVGVMLAFGGTWYKSPGAAEGTIDYVSKVEGVTVRCWSGQPPPSCKIVEVVEEVPAVPASKRIVRKLICKEPEAATV